MMTETNTENVEAGKTEDPLGWIKINVAYFKTIPGILKLVELIIGIICMACASPALLGATHWFLFVVIISFISTLCWCTIYLLSMREALNSYFPVNWVLLEALNSFGVSVLYLIACIVQLSSWSGVYSHYYKGSNITAGVFGLFNFLAYGASAYLIHAEWKASTATTQ